MTRGLLAFHYKRIWTCQLYNQYYTQDLTCLWVHIYGLGMSSTILYAHKTPHSHYAPLNEYKAMPNKSFYRIMFHYVVWISHYAPFGVWMPHYDPLKECDLILRLLKWEYPNTLFGVWLYHITPHLRIVAIHITPYRRSVTSHYTPLWKCEWIIYRCLATLRPIRNCEWMIYSCLAALHPV